MKSYKINELYGEAYNNAIQSIINHLNRLNWNWNYADNWRDAHELAMENEIDFDINGNFIF